MGRDTDFEMAEESVDERKARTGREPDSTERGWNVHSRSSGFHE